MGLSYDDSTINIVVIIIIIIHSVLVNCCVPSIVLFTNFRPGCISGEGKEKRKGGAERERGEGRGDKKERTVLQ